MPEQLTTQILDPDPTDAAVVGQVLGARGDIAYAEEGDQPLATGELGGEVTFLYEKVSADYRVEKDYEDPNDPPEDIRVVVTSKRTTGFSYELSAAPDTNLSSFHWQVQVRDALHVTQPPTSQPKYAILEPELQGATPFFLTLPTSADSREFKTRANIPLDVRDYGLVMDGVTDDSTALAAMLAEISEGAVVQFPAGECLLSAGISIDRAITFQGLGRDYGGTSFKVAAGITPITVADGVNNVQLKDFRIESIGLSRTAGSIGIKANAVSLNSSIGYLSLQNIEVIGFDHGVETRFNQIGVLDDVRSGGNNVGLYQKRCVNMTLEGGNYSGNTKWGIFLDGDTGFVNFSAGARISNTFATNNGSDSGGNVKCSYQDNVSFNNCMFDVPASGSVIGVRIEFCYGGSISGGTYIGSSTGGPGIIIQQCDGTRLIDSHVIGNLYGIRLISSKRCAIANNEIAASAGFDIWINNEDGTGSDGNIITGNTCFSGGIFENVGPNYSLVAFNETPPTSITLTSGSVGFLNKNYTTGSVLPYVGTATSLATYGITNVNIGGAPINIPLSVRTGIDRNLMFEDDAAGVRLRGVNDANTATVAYSLYAGLLNLVALPDADPGIPGRIYRSGVDLKVSI